MIGGAIDELIELRRLFGARASGIGNAADAVGVALRRFSSSSTEYVPALPDHRTRGHELASRCRDLGLRTERRRDALAAADRWGGTSLAMRARDAVGTTDAAWSGAVGLWQSRGPVAHGLRRLLDRIEPEHWKHAAFKRDVLGMEGRRIPGGKAWADELRTARNDRNAAVRAVLDRHRHAYDAWAEDQRWRRADVRDDVARLAGRLDPVARPDLAARAADEAASSWTRARHLVANTKLGAVARLGSEAFGAAGMAHDGLELYRGFHERDTEQMVTSGLGLAAGAAMLFPPTAAAGALVTGGLLVHEYRDEIADAGRHVRDALVDEVDRRVDQVKQAAGLVADGGRAVRDMLGAATGALGGLF